MLRARRPLAHQAHADARVAAAVVPHHHRVALVPVAAVAALRRAGLGSAVAARRGTGLGIGMAARRGAGLAGLGRGGGGVIGNGDGRREHQGEQQPAEHGQVLADIHRRILRSDVGVGRIHPDAPLRRTGDRLSLAEGAPGAGGHGSRRPGRRRAGIPAPSAGGRGPAPRKPGGAPRRSRRIARSAPSRRPGRKVRAPGRRAARRSIRAGHPRLRLPHRPAPRNSNRGRPPRPPPQVRPPVHGRPRDARRPPARRPARPPAAARKTRTDRRRHEARRSTPWGLGAGPIARIQTGTPDGPREFPVRRPQGEPRRVSGRQPGTRRPGTRKAATIVADPARDGKPAGLDAGHRGGYRGPCHGSRPPAPSTFTGKRPCA